MHPSGQISERVKGELAHNPYLKDKEILVSAEGDAVILDGVVDDMDKKWLAEDLALDTFGVLHVVNQIQVHRHH